MAEELYARPCNISDINACSFYHYMDLPGYGLVGNQWDLRGKEEDYLGHIKLEGKTVLEIGTASGYLCFYMERAGAKVTAFDLSEKQEWDIVPYANFDFTQHIINRKQGIARLNNAFWFAHNAFKSKARMVYGTVYKIPDAIGEFDICTLGSILLHLRDPFLALQQVSAHTKETIVITDMLENLIENNATSIPSNRRLMRFLPDSATCEPWETWWHMSPELVIEFIKILGFKNTTLSYHKQLYQKTACELYTIVGHRKD